MTENTNRGLWEQQFDPAFDFPTTTVTTKYVICTSPRCGSHYLGHLLHQAGGFGYPLEYVNKANLAVWTRRASENRAQSPLEFIKSVRTAPNGVFGIKVHYNQLATFLEHESDIVGYRYIVLERHDLLKQAISYAWAAQTRSWISGMPELHPAEYRWDQIAQKLSEIAESNAGWRSFLAGCGISPLFLTFEDVRKDPAHAIARVASFLNVTPEQTPGREGFFPIEQKQAGKREWLERFVTESRERLQRGDFPPREKAAPSLLSSLRRRLGARR
jgi:LPS sulfotransferase NodH